MHAHERNISAVNKTYRKFGFNTFILRFIYDSQDELNIHKIFSKLCQSLMTESN